MRLLRLLLIVIVSAGSIFAQLRFEVASIKPSIHGGSTVISPPANGVLHATNASVRMLIRVAYRLQDFQIVGGAGWMSSERYNVDARSARPVSADETRLMLQTLLAERFQLKVRSERKEAASLALLIGARGKGLNLTPADGAICLVEPGPANPCARLGGSPGGGISAEKISMDQFAAALTSMFQRMVVNKTGLEGVFDLKVKPSSNGLMPQSDAAQSASTQEMEGMSAVIKAIDEQLGLKLERLNTMIEILAIESAEKPSEN